MNVIPVRDRPFKRYYHSIGTKKNRDVKTPDFYCRDCGHNCSKYCEHLKRPIEPNVNRCFHHTHYSPIQVALKEDEPIKKLA